MKLLIRKFSSAFRTCSFLSPVIFLKILLSGALSLCYPPQHPYRGGKIVIVNNTV